LGEGGKNAQNASTSHANEHNNASNQHPQHQQSKAIVHPCHKYQSMPCKASNSTGKQHKPHTNPAATAQPTASKALKERMFHSTKTSISPSFPFFTPESKHAFLLPTQRTSGMDFGGERSEAGQSHGAGSDGRSDRSGEGSVAVERGAGMRCLWQQRK
jgi:hypothetical protein